MKDIFKYTSIPLTLSILFISFLYGQEWKKQPLGNNSDSLFAIYSWQAHDEYHSAYGEIILTKKGRFKYSSHQPLNFNEFSEGKYVLKNHIISLTSDLQPDNIKVAIEYVDTTIADTLYRRLYFPRNNKGELIYSGYYFLNNDTTINGWFDPAYPLNRRLLNSIYSIKVAFNAAGFGSSWIPITRTDKFIKVTILTTDNYTDYKPKVFKNWTFKINKSRLVDFTKQ